MLNQPESESLPDNTIPDKCRDCPIANITVAMLIGFEQSTDGPDSYLHEITEICPGYNIAPSDAQVHPADIVETIDGKYMMFAVPSRNQLARCAMKVTKE
jgi:hypothetical protein